MAYTPPTTPAITLNFVDDPYTPPSSPSIVLNFTEGVGPPANDPTTINTSFFIILVG